MEYFALFRLFVMLQLELKKEGGNQNHKTERVRPCTFFLPVHQLIPVTGHQWFSQSSIVNG